MAIDIKELVTSIRTQLKTAFGTRYVKKRLEWLQPYPIGIPINVSMTIQRRDWSRLVRKASKYRHDALRDLTGITTQQQEWGHVWDDIERLRPLAEKYWKPPGQLSEWPAMRSRALRELRKNGFTQTKAQQAVADLAKFSAQDVLKALSTQWGRELEVGATIRFSALAAADISEAVAQFNMKYEKSSWLKPAQKSVRGLDAEISSLLRSLYAAFRTGRRQVIVTKARRAEMRAAQLLEPLLDAAAYWALQLELSEKKFNAVAGRNAVEVADAIRMALFACSAARVVIWKAGWPEGSSFVDSWRKAAKSKSFESVFRAPRVTPIADIATAPEAFNGKYISVEGRVGPLAVLHRGKGKVVSSTAVIDATGAVVQVGLPYIELGSGGLVSGAYVQLTGTFASKHKDFQTRVLVLDRRSLTEESRISWLAWLALQLLPVITPIPHNLAARWSWVPGSNGAGNSLKNGMWSSGRRSV